MPYQYFGADRNHKGEQIWSMREADIQKLRYEAAKAARAEVESVINDMENRISELEALSNMRRPARDYTARILAAFATLLSASISGLIILTLLGQ